MANLPGYHIHDGCHNCIYAHREGGDWDAPDELFCTRIEPFQPRPDTSCGSELFKRWEEDREAAEKWMGDIWNRYGEYLARSQVDERGVCDEWQEETELSLL